MRRPIRLTTGLKGLLLTAILAALSTGCAHVPYQLGQNMETKYTLKLKPGEPQFETGRPVAFVDGAGHYFFSLPSKLLLLNWRIDNHNISPETKQKVMHYLHVNGLHNVKVRFNQYAPGAEWIRLFKNKEVGAGWRYTLGLFSVIGYTILPGRIFGGDHYNPYTNTINIYSDVPAVGIHEAAHAKDFAKRSRQFKGFYALIRALPLIALIQEANATGDAIGYYRAHKLVSDEKNGYKVLYPAYFTYLGGEALAFTPNSKINPTAFIYLAAIPGHILGRLRALFVKEGQPAPY